MRAQNMRWAIITLCTVHIERVHLGACRVVARDIQRVKVIPIGINARAFSHGKPHLSEDGCHLFLDLRNRVDCTHRTFACWQSNVQPFVAQTFVQCGVRQTRFLSGQGAVDLVLKRVQGRTCSLTLFWGHLAQLTHFQRDFTFFANGSKADVFQHSLISSVCDLI